MAGFMAASFVITVKRAPCLNVPGRFAGGASAWTFYFRA
jgi:hypothetical protein